MKTIRTVNVIDVAWLNYALRRHEEWRGNHNPDEYDFDACTARIKAAIKQVDVDRKRLRALLIAQ